MAWSIRTVIITCLWPLILWWPLGQLFWDIYQRQGMSLALFAGLFNTVYLGLTTLYFMLLWLWNVLPGKKVVHRMKDIHRVWLIFFIACIPFFLALLAVALVTSVAIAPVTFEHFLILLAAGIFGLFILWKSDRMRHYNKVFAKHEENYRYEKEAQ